MIPIKNCINKCVSTKSFLDELKVANVISVFKKEDPNNKATYRPISSLLPLVSEIFERVLFEQIEKFCKKIFSPKLCGFRKCHSTQHALNLLKNWQKNLDKSSVLGTVLMELTKAYYCLPHDLLIAKLAAYGFEDSATSVISDYLSKRYQQVKTRSVLSSYQEILRGIPQGSILEPILFNIFINDFIFSFKKQNFAILPMTLPYTHAH